MIAYALRRLRRGGELAFARRSDKALLAIMALITGLWLQSILINLPTKSADATVTVAVFTLCGLFTGYRIRIILTDLSARSVIAPAALATLQRPSVALVTTLVTGGLLAGTFVRIASGRLPWPALTAALVAQASCFAFGYLLAGQVATLGWQRMLHRRRVERKIIPSRSGDTDLRTIALSLQFPFLRKHEAAVAGVMGLIAGTVGSFAHQLTHGVVALLVTGLCALVVATAVSRISPAICRYSCYLGLLSSEVIWAHCRLLMVAGATTITFSLLLGLPAGTIALQAAIYVAMLYLTALRILHYRQFSKSKSNLLLQIELCAIALAAALLPPIAVGLMLIIPWQLVRREPSVRLVA